FLTSLYFSLSNYHAVQRAQCSFPTRRSSDLGAERADVHVGTAAQLLPLRGRAAVDQREPHALSDSETGLRIVDALGYLVGQLLRSEEHTSELQSRENLVCRLLLEKKNNNFND